MDLKVQFLSIIIISDYIVVVLSLTHITQLFYRSLIFWLKSLKFHKIGQRHHVKAFSLHQRFFFLYALNVSYMCVCVQICMYVLYEYEREIS